ncbi:MAG: N-6 DNA methylase, partial [Candidatus Cloacimonetes bacterium]|nr:N-6 DNA methylase [Candidatus Cloacimonadota bacterium]
MNKLLSVNNQGNLINEHLLLELSNEKTKYKFAQPDSFRWFGDDALDTPHILNLIIANRYEDLVARWDMYFNDFEKYSISELRERWIKPFFAAFSYDLQFQRGDVHSGDFTFYLSHRGWDQESAPYIHSVQWDQYLDAKTSDGRNTYSPHDTMQRFLISSKEHTWGIVTNGKKLRLLRDFHHETRKAYIEFDLETLFQGRNFSDFRLLWRLIHPSRFFPTPDSNESRLEQMFVESKAAGVSIGEDLKLNVRIAIEELANGFLYSTHGLTDKLVDDPTKCAEFHHQLLRVIYRILFLLYAEQRNLMPIRSSLYFKEYSISAIREKIESGMILEDDFTDLWEGLKVTFEMVRQGVDTMGIPNYNGLLFDPGEIEWLASCTCKNSQLLTAIRYMTTMEKGGLLQRISYVELDVDEIGAIYESLLDYIPRVSSQLEIFEDVMLIDGKHKNTTREIASRTFFLDPRGTNRKSSGTYYTNPGLVNALIESALKPVMEQRLAGAEKDKESQINALLSLDVCDPAAGSGAFLIASTEFLGEKLAVLQTQDEYPSDKAIRHARRDVLRHCIYGVDLNPLAVELCKVSLWLISATDDLPLNFLDHHIKCGNSLIGTTPELIKKGIPPDAFNPVIGDEKHVCTERKKQARNDVKDLKSGQLYGMFMPKSENLIFTQKTDFAEEYSENTTDEINELIQDYQHSQRDESFTYKKFIADYWTAAFFWQHKDLAKSPLERGVPNDFGTGCVRPSQWLEKQDDSSPPQRSEKEYPNNHILFDLMKGNREAVSPEIASEVKELAGNYKFFHWYLEFPQVFEKGGFDCMLGNPPWDNVQPEEKQFFATYDPEIAEMSGNNRKKAIESLIESNSDLYEKWNKFKRDIYVFSRFVRESGKYFLTARGKLNLYPIFAETFKDHINEHGRAGFIVPTGIATDDSTKAYFGNLIDTKSLVRLFDFENKEAIFPDVHRSYKFCLLTIAGKQIDRSQFSFFSTNLDHLNDKIRQFTLSPNDIERINPNTKTTPIFRTKVDAELTKKIYQQVPVLINEENDVNPWEISFRQGLFNMTSDSHLFHTEPAEDRVPLYEAKMIWQYDHR